MSMRKRRVFDVDLPEEPAASPLPRRRGPMATAIGEASEAARDRAQALAEVRAENDALAHEFVRLREMGLVIETIPLDRIRASRLARDRHDPEVDLAELKASLLAVGLSNPIRVDPDGGGFELVQGLRRLTAYRALHAETGDERWAAIPAAVFPRGETPALLYRRMVDENLVRTDVSFAELALLAMRYAEDRVDGCASVDAAVNALYGSAGAQKRSYIRRFARLMAQVGSHLEHPAAIPRALGLALSERIEADGPEALVEVLREAAGRDADAEIALLRRFADEPRRPRPRTARARSSTRSFGTKLGKIRLTHSADRVEIRLAAEVDAAKLDAAVAAFVAALSD